MPTTFCANPSCLKHTQYRGGHFTFKASTNEWLCDECYAFSGMNQTCKNLWDFETTHFTGERVHIRSLSHLRQLEKTHGVSNFAANYDTRNWNTTPSQR